MKSHPLKQTKLTQLDNAGLYHKIKKGIPRALGTMSAIFAGGPIAGGVRTGVGLLSGGFFGGRAAGNIVNFGSKTMGRSGQILKKLQNKLYKVKQKYPSALPKNWNKGGSKQAFDNLKRYSNPNKPMGPSKESIDYILNYSKDFGPIIKNMKK